MATRTQFSALIREKLKEVGVSIRGAAGHLQVPYGTLQGWIRKNTFPEDQIGPILGLLELDLSTEELGERYEFKVTADSPTPHSMALEITGGDEAEPDYQRKFELALDRMALATTRLGGAQQSFPEDVEVLFASLPGNAYYVFASLDLPPYEMTPVGWKATGDSIRAALERGATFVYLRPGAAAADQLVSTWKQSVPSPAESENLFEEFVETILAAARRDATTPELKAPRVIQVLTPVNPFLCPGHKFVYFAARNGEERQVRGEVLARFPAQTREELHVVASDDFQNAFPTFLRALVRRALQSASEGEFQLRAPDGIDPREVLADLHSGVLV